MINLLIWQTVVIGMAVPLIGVWGDWDQAWSFLTGGVLLLLSLAIYGLVFLLIFRQKFVALAPALIVIKYAILGILIPKLITLNWISELWLGLGFCSIAVGGLMAAVEQAFTERNRQA